MPRLLVSISVLSGGSFISTGDRRQMGDEFRLVRV